MHPALPATCAALLLSACMSEPDLLAGGLDAGRLSAGDLAELSEIFEEAEIRDGDGPESGRLSMEGVITFRTPDDPRVILPTEEYFVGRMELEADFDGGTVDGTAGKFSAFDVSWSEESDLVAVYLRDLEGTVTLDGLARAGWLEGTFDGVLTDAGDMLVVQGAFEGAVYQSGDEMVTTGRWFPTTEMSRDADAHTLVYGNFVAKAF